jgi:hypothetical protein
VHSPERDAQILEYAQQDLPAWLIVGAGCLAGTSIFLLVFGLMAMTFGIP